VQQYIALSVHSIRLLRESVFFKRFYTAWTQSGPRMILIAGVDPAKLYREFLEYGQLGL